MSVATHLGLDPASTAIVGLEQRWAGWVDQFPRLARAGDLGSLRGWLAAAGAAEADEVLHTLAALGSPSGADDLAAASVLAWALLPGACALAHRLHALSPRIDEVVAAQLWLEVRSFPWNRLHKVAANILANTRAGVLRECGARSQTKRADKAWTNTQLVDPAASFWNRHAAGLDPVPSAADELLALLDSACAANVITDAVEVMNVNQIYLDSSRVAIGSLLDPAGQRNAAVGRLAGCVDLYRVSRPKPRQRAACLPGCVPRSRSAGPTSGGWRHEGSSGHSASGVSG
jgi:hypothetical protein